jgi:hypothetical protein
LRNRAECLDNVADLVKCIRHMTNAIEKTVRDYFEGWFDGDIVRMDRALHPDLVKRRAVPGALGLLTKERMLELTAAGAGAEDAVDRRLEIRVLDVSEEIASAVAVSAVYYEYVHLIRTPEGWRIANAFWRLR